jgi:2-phosphosulfolactate phosphatase
VVVIDVLRAFTVSAYALAGGAREILYVADLEQARRVAAAIPGAVLSAEVDGLPVEGVAISNSPSQVAAADLAGRTLVQRSSAGVQALAAVAPHADGLLAASFVVASATAAEIRRRGPDLVTLLPSVLEHDEDVACAAALEDLLKGRRPDLDALLAPLRASQRYAELAAGTRPGFPATDLDLALTLDRFDFPLPVQTGKDGMLRVRRPLRPDAPNT